MEEITKTGADSDELSKDDIEAAKKKTRVNALALALVFLLATLAPYPWNAYAPILIIIPAIYSIVNRIRNNSLSQTSQSQNSPQPDVSSDGEPYAITPKDPSNPRRYKPIE